MDKNYNLLQEQLAESGLEMQLAGVFAGISAVSSIAGGIFGATQAAEQNAAGERAAEEARELAEEDAKLQNEYNKERFEADKKNYFAERQFAFDTAIKDWEYRNQIQDYNFRQAGRRYAQSVENYNDQLKFNRIAADEAYRSEQNALNDFITNQAFTKEGALIDMLQKQGTAQAGQAGRSRNKAVTSTIAEYGRNMGILAESLYSNVKATDQSFRDIAQQKYGADLSAKSNLLIKPEALPYAPKPEMGPERIFVEPREVLPGFTQPYVPVSTTAPLIASFGQAAGSLASINWGGPNTPSQGNQFNYNQNFWTP